MGAENEQVETTRVVKSARPWTGFFLGLLFGVALAVILQQSGVWPLDRLLLFGSAGLFALIGILLGGAGRQRVGAFNSILPLILAVALLAFGATGIAGVNEHGELNGGCTVQASSDLDETVVTDTSRQDPFDIDPNGSLSWVATSPGPIMDHLWEIYVDIGGFPIVVANNDEPELNTSGDLDNTGDVADVSGYVEEVSNYAGVELEGVFEVGGNIDGDGGACDGFGFVRLVEDPLTSPITLIAAGVGLLALLGLLILVFNRTREAEVVIDEAEDDMGDAYAELSGAAGGDSGKVGAHEASEGMAGGAAVGEQEPDGGDASESGDSGDAPSQA